MRPKEIFPQRIETDAGHWVRERTQHILETPDPNEHHKEMSFLNHLMLYGETDERQVMGEKLAGAERNERCARRAVWLMVVFTTMAVLGLGYAVLLLDEFTPNTARFVTRTFGAIGLASLVSLLAFVGFWLVSRGKLDDQREGCRRLVTKIVESRLGKPVTASSADILKRRSAPRRVAAEGCEASPGNT